MMNGKTVRNTMYPQQYLIISLLLLAIMIYINPLDSYLKEKDPKIIVIGIDAAEWNVMTPLIKAGKLPNIERLIKTGYSGELETTVASSPIAWSSAITGMYPEKHGVNSFTICTDGTARDDCNKTKYFTDSSFLRKKGFFEILGDEGYKSIITFIPFIGFPVWQINGIMVGLPKTGNRPEIKNRNKIYPLDILKTLPEEIKKSIDCITDQTLADVVNKDTCKNFGYVGGQERGKLLDRYAQLMNDEDDWKRINEQVIYRLNNIHLKKEVASHLVAYNDYDIFMIVFDEIDYLQHIYWKYCDDKHPQYLKSYKDRHDRIIEYGYMEVDRAIGELLYNIGDDRVVFILSDHGARGAVEFKMDALNNMLRNFSGYEIDRCDGLKIKKIAIKSSNSQYGLCYSDLSGVKNKDKLDEVIMLLKNITLSDTSDRLFPRVTKVSRNDVDLIMSINVSLLYKNQGSSIVFKSRDKSEMYPVSEVIISGMPGRHRKEGVYILNGPMIQQGIKKRNITEIAPTILYSLGKPVPREMDGEVIIEAFTKDFKDNNPLVIEDLNLDVKRKRIEWGNETTKRDSEELLRTLGYIA